ncbi:glycosyltransferase [Flavobacterium sp. SUN052]|uniref:glycosyltransferase n=1 Tax=Flavobacterium sp. SUN052 TaxID=3002441 RepID=UPI00237DFB83|nr:glycosyltransferase [Flavobacterium sp. SUN052]MEC4005491.1 glycosyltransferase [Flavobacterium sp. SUN052]
MIRVLNIVETINSGGVERRRLSMAKLLDKSEFELKIICTNAVGDFPKEFKKYGVELIEIGDLKSIFSFKQYLKVIKVINLFKPHIIHGAVFEGVTLAALTGFFKRVPVVIIEETSDPQTRSWRGNLFMKIFAKLSNKVIGVSPASTGYLIHKLKINPKKVVLINNGVAQPNISNEEQIIILKQELNIKKNEIVIGSMGRMDSDQTKRFSDLIKAFAILNKNEFFVKLLLVGDGKEKANYEQLVKELSIEKNVIFTGYQNDVHSYFSIIDIFSLVSSHESFGLVLAEAMLHRIPIVATKVGGMQYIVDDEITGFLVEKYNIYAIENKLKLLCEDKNLRLKMGQSGYEKALKNYTEEQYVMNIQNLYFSLRKQKVIKLLSL